VKRALNNIFTTYTILYSAFS